MLISPFRLTAVTETAPNSTKSRPKSQTILWVPQFDHFRVAFSNEPYPDFRHANWKPRTPHQWSWAWWWKAILSKVDKIYLLQDRMVWNMGNQWQMRVCRGSKQYLCWNASERASEVVELLWRKPGVRRDTDLRCTFILSCRFFVYCCSYQWFIYQGSFCKSIIDIILTTSWYP